MLQPINQAIQSIQYQLDDKFNGTRLIPIAGTEHNNPEDDFTAGMFTACLTYNNNAQLQGYDEDDFLVDFLTKEAEIIIDSWLWSQIPEELAEKHNIVINTKSMVKAYDLQDEDGDLLAKVTYCWYDNTFHISWLVYSL